MPQGTRSANREFFVGLARAFAGALIFALPMLMTMEMWWLGSYMDGGKLALLTLVTFPLLVLLSHFVGFEQTFDWKEDVVDALVAYATAVAMATAILALIDVIDFRTAIGEALGIVALQAVPGAIGALLAFSQLGEAGDAESNGSEPDWKENPGYGRELFLMLLGALFLSLNLAPTEEMVLIAHKMSPLHTVTLIGVSLLIMHAFVYSVEFRGQHSVPEESGPLVIFVRFTVVGFVLALLASAYMLWTFGRFDGTAVSEILAITAVLAFPASIGAAAARLIL